MHFCSGISYLMDLVSYKFSLSPASEMNFYITNMYSSTYCSSNVSQTRFISTDLEILSPWGHITVQFPKNQMKWRRKLARCSLYNVRRSPHAWNFFQKFALVKSTGSSPVNATQEVFVSEILVIMQISQIASCVLIANAVQKTRVFTCKYQCRPNSLRTQTSILSNDRWKFFEFDRKNTR